MTRLLTGQRLEEAPNTEEFFNTFKQDGALEAAETLFKKIGTIGGAEADAKRVLSAIESDYAFDSVAFTLSMNGRDFAPLSAMPTEVELQERQDLFQPARRRGPAHVGFLTPGQAPPGYIRQAAELVKLGAFNLEDPRNRAFVRDSVKVFTPEEANERLKSLGLTFRRKDAITQGHLQAIIELEQERNAAQALVDSNDLSTLGTTNIAAALLAVVKDPVTLGLGVVLGSVAAISAPAIAAGLGVKSTAGLLLTEAAVVGLGEATSEAIIQNQILQSVEGIRQDYGMVEAFEAVIFAGMFGAVLPPILGGAFKGTKAIIRKTTQSTSDLASSIIGKFSDRPMRRHVVALSKELSEIIEQKLGHKRWEFPDIEGEMDLHGASAVRDMLEMTKQGIMGGGRIPVFDIIYDGSAGTKLFKTIPGIESLPTGVKVVKVEGGFRATVQGAPEGISVPPGTGKTMEAAIEQATHNFFEASNELLRPKTRTALKEGLEKLKGVTAREQDLLSSTFKKRILSARQAFNRTVALLKKLRAAKTDAEGANVMGYVASKQDFAERGGRDGMIKAVEEIVKDLEADINELRLTGMLEGLEKEVKGLGPDSPLNPKSVEDLMSAAKANREAPSQSFDNNFDVEKNIAQRVENIEKTADLGSANKQLDEVLDEEADSLAAAVKEAGDEEAAAFFDKEFGGALTGKLSSKAEQAALDAKIPENASLKKQRGAVKGKIKDAKGRVGETAKDLVEGNKKDALITKLNEVDPSKPKTEAGLKKIGIKTKKDIAEAIIEAPEPTARVDTPDQIAARSELTDLEAELVKIEDKMDVNRTKAVEQGGEVTPLKKEADLFEQTEQAVKDLVDCLGRG